MQQSIVEPTPGDIQELARDVLHVEELAATNLGRTLRGDLSDLDTIQALLESGVVDRNDSDGIHALGVVLGRVLLTHLNGFDWAIVKDKYGRDAGLRYLHTSLVIFPTAMLAKRIERGEELSIRELYQATMDELPHLISMQPAAS